MPDDQFVLYPCRHCRCNRPTYPDVTLNQRIERCCFCHARLADGAMLPSADKARLLDRGEQMGEDVFSMSEFALTDHNERRRRQRNGPGREPLQ